MGGTALPIGLVAAVGRNGVIGANGGLPWRLSGDLRHFKTLTLGKPVIMGRKTFESIGRVLPGRRTIVVSSRSDLGTPEIDVARSVRAAIELAQSIGKHLGAREIAVAGGAEIFIQTMDVATVLHMTEVDSEPAGDVFFPPIDPLRWREVSRQAHPASARDETSFAFVEYRRR